MVSGRDLSSAFGFTCMLGGTLFGLLTVLVTLLPSGGAPELAAGDSMLLLALLFLVPSASTSPSGRCCPGPGRWHAGRYWWACRWSCCWAWRRSPA